VSYGGDGDGSPVTRLDFDMNDHFAKEDVQSAISFTRLGLLVCPPPPEFDLHARHRLVQSFCAALAC